MDSFEWNKIAGWVLAAAIAVLGLALATGMLFAPHKLEKPGYVVEGVEAEAAGGAPAEAEKPIAFYLATADKAKGENQFKKCAACHTITAGGPAGIGPNLYGVVGLPHAHMQGFAYSEALTKMHGAIWSFDELNKWLQSPKAYAPGTKMAFAGLSKPQDRADVIAYLNSQSASPKPYPPVPAADAAAAPATAADAPVAGTSGDKPAVEAGKAPDTVDATKSSQPGKQPQGNVGGPGASSVTGTSKNEAPAKAAGTIAAK